MRGNPVTMSSGLSWKLCLILLVLINLFECGRGQDFLNPHVCLNTGNYTANSTYIRNLNDTLSALSSNASQYGFYSASVGQGQDRAHAVALCRADTRIDQCRNCVANAAIELLQLCPSQKQAIRWYEMCMLHYSNQPINGNPTNIPQQGLVNTAAVDNPVQFRQDRTALLGVIRPQAANGSSLIKVGVGRWTMNDSNIINAMLQCIPTLSPEECNDCLIQATQDLSRTAQGARQMRASCTLRYELYPFSNETRLRELNVVLPELPNSPPPAGTSRGKKDDNTAKIAVSIVVPIVVCLILAACAVFFLRKRHRRLPEIPENPEEISTVESLQYDFGRISAVTNDFADANKLGEGGFGSVYKGTLPNGQEIAVKRLSRKSGQGDKEFKNEVLLVARLQHRNLVRLLGFSLVRTERLLIYEYVQNGSLDHFIFDPIKGSQLDWKRRYKIIGGIARGLLYLHEDSRLRIIHRDLKPSNVLLDGEMNPKIADFGMARLFGHDETQGNTSQIVGTYGYMSPEYAIYGQFSVKSDVFSFGVLVMEIVSGRRNIRASGENIEDILSFVWQNWCQGTTENIIDPVLRDGRGSVHDMLRCIHIALLCVQEDAADRPTMNTVMVMLSSSTVTLPVPSRPAFVMLSRFNGVGNKVHDSGETDSSKESKSKQYVSDASSQNEMSVTEFYPR